MDTPLLWHIPLSHFDDVDERSEGARIRRRWKRDRTPSTTKEARMRQLTCTAPHQIEWRDVPEPRLESGTDALVRPLAVARCDIDLFLTSGFVPLRWQFALCYVDVAAVVVIRGS